jgi:hypothetical protein
MTTSILLHTWQPLNKRLPRTKRKNLTHTPYHTTPKCQEEIQKNPAYLEQKFQKNLDKTPHYSVK